MEIKELAVCKVPLLGMAFKVFWGDKVVLSMMRSLESLDFKGAVLYQQSFWVYKDYLEIREIKVFKGI